MSLLPYKVITKTTGDLNHKDIHQLLSSPIAFLRTSPIGSNNLLDFHEQREARKDGRVLPRKVFAKLDKCQNPFNPHVTWYQIKARLSDDGSHNLLHSYLLQSPSNKEPTYVDIPVHPAKDEPRLLVTEELGGCSVVVRRLNETTYRVYHDRGLNTSICYPDVVMAIDHFRYGMLPHEGDLATVLMHYDPEARQWSLLVQRLKRNLKVWSKEANAERYCAPVPLNIHTEETYPQLALPPGDTRDRVRRKMKTWINAYAPEEFTVGDGAFVHPGPEGKATLANDAVKSTQVMRNYLQGVLADIKSDKLKPELIQLRDWCQDSGGKEAMSRHLSDLIQESKDEDFTYLRCRRELIDRENRVFDDLQVESGLLGDTAGERFADLHSRLLELSNQDLAQGYLMDTALVLPEDIVPRDMAIVDMKELLTGDEVTLTDVQKGALLKRIDDECLRLYRDEIWTEADAVVRRFQDAQGIVTGAPQVALFESATDVAAGGRCYPLVRAAAVALDEQGPRAMEDIMAKIVSMERRTTNDGELLRGCLHRLHGNEDARAASNRLEGQFTLEDAMAELTLGDGQSRSKMLALNTEDHAMLLGVTRSNGPQAQLQYHFYDPNFALLTLQSQEAFAMVVRQHLVDNGFAEKYSAAGTQDHPTFTLVEMDAPRMAAVDIGHGLTVGDLGAHRSLRESVTLAVSDPFSSRLPRLSSSADAFLGALRLAEGWRSAVPRLQNEAGLDAHWMPILSTMERQPEGLQVRFLNLNNPGESERVATVTELDVLELRNHLDEQLQRLGQVATVEEGGTVKLHEPKEVSGEPIDGLNAMFLVQMVFEYLNPSKKPPVDDSPPSESTKTLEKALQAHSYFNMAQITYSTTQDVGKMISLTRELIVAEQANAKTLSRFSSTLGRVLGFLGEALGVLFAAGSVVLDIIELANGEDSAQKAVLTTQLVFDGVNLGVATGGTVASLMGAATVGAMLGAAGVLLAGVGIGVGALVQAFGEVAHKAEAVGKYFADAQESYRAGGYKYDAEKKWLMPLPGAVIRQLDLGANTVTFDSQYLYRAPDKGRIWPCNFPSVDHRKELAIHVREALYAPNVEGTLPPEGERDLTAVIILPSVVKSYIAVDWNQLPFSLHRHDRGFDLLRQIEKDNDPNWLYNFYSWPAEYIVHKLHQYYATTPVDVYLSQRSVRLAMPPLLKAQENYLEYTLHGAGAQYVVDLRRGSSLTLTTTHADTRWVLDGRELPSDSVTFGDAPTGQRMLRIGGVSVTVDSTRNKDSSLLVLASNKATLAIDLESQTIEPCEIPADKWYGEDDGQTLEQHLHDLHSRNHLHSSYVIVDDYTAPYDSNQEVGRAFYEVSRERMLYSVGVPLDLTKEAQLGGVFGDDVYFYCATKEHHALWRVDAPTGTLAAQYCPLFNSSEVTLKRVWQHSHVLYATYFYRYADDDKGDQTAELTCVVHADSMVLATITDQHLFEKLISEKLIKGGDVESLLKETYQSTKSSSALDFITGQRVIKAIIRGAILTVNNGNDNHDEAVTASNSQQRFCWLRLQDGMVINPWDKWLSNDYGFVGSVPIAASEESGEQNAQDQELIFYNPKMHILRRLVDIHGDFTCKEVDIPPEFSELDHVIQQADRFILTTKAGYIMQLMPGGAPALVAVSRDWLSSQQDPSTSLLSWWDQLTGLAKQHNAPSLAVMGLCVGAPPAEKSVPVWCHDDRIIIASAELHGRFLQLLGLSPDGESALLCDYGVPGDCKLFQQPLIPRGHVPKVLQNLYINGTIADGAVPKAQAKFTKLTLSAVASVGNRVECVDHEGVRLRLRGNFSSATVIGVTRAWQKPVQASLESSLFWLQRRRGGLSPVLVVEADETQSSGPAWYNLETNRIYRFTADNKDAMIDPYHAWLGVHATDATIAYVHSSGNKVLYQVTSSESRPLWRSPFITRLDNTLAFSIPAQTNVNLPVIAGADHCLVTFDSTQGGGVLSISKESWEYYKAITVANYEAMEERNAIYLETDHLASFMAVESNCDLMFIDPRTSRSIALDNACSLPQVAKDDDTSFIISSSSGPSSGRSSTTDEWQIWELRRIHEKRLQLLETWLPQRVLMVLDQVPRSIFP